MIKLMKTSRKVKLFSRLLVALKKIPKRKREPVKSDWYGWVLKEQGQCGCGVLGTHDHDYYPCCGRHTCCRAPDFEE